MVGRLRGGGGGRVGHFVLGSGEGAGCRVWSFEKSFWWGRA